MNCLYYYKKCFGKCLYIISSKRGLIPKGIIVEFVATNINLGNKCRVICTLAKAITVTKLTYSNQSIILKQNLVNWVEMYIESDFSKVIFNDEY